MTPGTSCTTAARRPRMRLTSVDLPTFGRPTMATTGSGPSWSRSCPAPAARPAARLAPARRSRLDDARPVGPARCCRRPRRPRPAAAGCRRGCCRTRRGGAGPRPGRRSRPRRSCPAAPARRWARTSGRGQVDLQRRVGQRRRCRCRGPRRRPLGRADELALLGDQLPAHGRARRRPARPRGSPRRRGSRRRRRRRPP